MVSGNNKVRIIDTSTAFRIHPEWAYGFAEMDKHQAEKVRSARFVAILAATPPAPSASFVPCAQQASCRMATL